MRGLALQYFQEIAGGNYSVVGTESPPEPVHSLQISPAFHSGRLDLDHWPLMDRHVSVLRIFPPQKEYGPVVSLSFDQNLCPPGNQHIGKPSPVVVVSVDDHGNMRVFPDVFDSFQEQREPLFGFFVDRRIELLAIEGKADRNNVRPAFSIRGGQVSHARRVEERCDLSGCGHVGVLRIDDRGWQKDDVQCSRFENQFSYLRSSILHLPSSRF